MAEALLGAVLGEAVSELSVTIKHVMRKTTQFKSNLTQIQDTIKRIEPIFNEIVILNKVLDRPEQETAMFIAHMEGAKDLVLECANIKWKFIKTYPHASKLEDLNASLLRFFQSEVLLQVARDVKEVLVVQRRMEKGSSGGWSSGVPLLKGVVIGFDDRVRALKAMLLKDSGVNVIVVSGPGGCGKTTLVTMLCHDPQIQGKFGSNIYFATISNTPNLQVVTRNLLPKIHAGETLKFSNDEDADHQWGSFLHENRSDVLLVLDDVWSDSVITHFRGNSPGYKILVTSRNTYMQFNTYELQLLNNQDATKLFHHSAFSEDGSKRTDIPADLVDKLVKCCKNHPLALSVIGSMLKGKHSSRWELMSKNLSEGTKSVLDLHESILLCLEKSLFLFKDEPEIQQCYLDLGLFPEDQKITATALMDIWVHLYKHDNGGLNTLNNLFELSFKNVATLLPIRKHSPAIANCCEEIYVMQHDMLRTLAIRLNNQDKEESTKRLILNPERQDLPSSNETINARIVSISTDERSCSRWNNIKVPNVEVLVLNFMSEIHPLPQFMENMQRLKVLIITNYGYYFSELENFPTSQSLSALTSIRLDHVSISLISRSILELECLQKLSLIMCKIGNSFNEYTSGIPNKLSNLVEIDIDSCDDLLQFPAMLCNLVGLRKLSITNCLELKSLSEGFGNLTNLEVLRLASCSNLTAIPESLRNLQKLRVIDVSHCLSLNELPARIGELGSLRNIHMTGCTGLHELPPSVKELHPLKVFCNEEIALLWCDYDVEVEVVEEDRLDTLSKIIPRDVYGH